MTCGAAVIIWDDEMVPEIQGRTALVTGIRGQDGTYLAKLLASCGYAVIGTSHRIKDDSSLVVNGEEIPVVRLDLADSHSIRDTLECYRPDEIYNLASRSSSTQLFDDAVATAEINGLAVVRFLEYIRAVCPETRFCQASSSEVFANSLVSPQDESTPLRPRNAYGAAKVYAQNMIENYRNRFGVFACSAILYNHESPLRGMEYVTRKVTFSAARIAAGQDKTIMLGNLESRRDWGYAGDYVNAMWRMLQQPEPGDYVVATGETHSVRELCELAFSRVGLDYRNHVVMDQKLERSPDAIELCGNASKARSMLGWKPSVTFSELVHMMVDADRYTLSNVNVPDVKSRGTNVSQD